MSLIFHLIKKLIDSEASGWRKINISILIVSNLKTNLKLIKKRTKNTYGFKDKGKNYTMTISTEMLNDHATIEK